MNVTLSVEAGILQRAREVARSQGTSLNELIRRYLESIAGLQDRRATVEALRAQWRAAEGHSGGKAWKRDDAYEDQL